MDRYNAALDSQAQPMIHYGILHRARAALAVNKRSDDFVLDIVFGENSGTVTARSLQTALRTMDISGTLYLGSNCLTAETAEL
jgi:hypothetical protein